MAPFVDTLNESVAKKLYAEINNADEAFVSEMTSIFFQQFKLTSLDKVLA
jgi:hypothetical protein